MMARLAKEGYDHGYRLNGIVQGGYYGSTDRLGRTYAIYMTKSETGEGTQVPAGELLAPGLPPLHALDSKWAVDVTGIVWDKLQKKHPTKEWQHSVLPQARVALVRVWVSGRRHYHWQPHPDEDQKWEKEF